MIEFARDTVMRDTVVEKIDSVHTIVNITETKIIHLQDTIVTHVYDTIQPDLITVYDKMFTTQDNNFDNILILITVIVTVLIVAVTAFNFWGAREVFKIEFKKMLKDERAHIKKSALEDVEKEFNGVKAENARVMAVSCSQNELYSQEIVWWARCVGYSSLSDKENLLNYSVNDLLTSLKEIYSIPSFWEGLEGNGFIMKEFEYNLNQIPLIMTQRQEILELFEKFKEECPDSFKGE